MKLKTKLSLAFGLFFVALLLLAFLGGNGIYRLNDATQVILEDNNESLEYVRGMLRSLDNRDFTVFAQNLEKQKDNITEIGEQEVVNVLQSGFDSLLANAGNPGQILRFDALVREKLYQIWDINQAAILRKSNEARHTGENAFQLIGILSTLLVLLAFTFMLNLPSYISRPIAELRDGIRQILQRNYTARVEVRSSDELGELASAFNEMAQKLDFWEHSNWAQVLFEKRRIETIIEQMQDAIIGLDERQQVLFVNPVMEKLLGLTAKDMVGKNALEIALRNDLLRHLLRKENTAAGDLKIFFEGRESFFNEEKHEVRNDNEVIGQVIVLKNVTVFRELDMAKTNFIATISHELKTPISAIKMSLKLLADERIGPLNEEQQKLIGQIRDDSERLLHITGELLDLAQVETGNIRLAVAPTRVDYLVGYASKAVESAMKEKGLHLDVQLAPDLPTLQLDAEKTAWVLVNLLTNAIKHSPDGERIEVRARRGKDAVLVSVRDYGKGIEEKYQQRLFERFFQAPSNGGKVTAGGSGLGLAISKDFIEAQGGRIWVESKPGAGATFTFSLPANE
ncbi:MAG: HAMP domain-containing protein [Haliscomenobacteraceae bacterium CHB4]|nr:Alginate biosynthesis sensor protein KinB [Saprospiraceae bacterium]MCE7925218.1 HAMP domain-containing protein [Haliscomenobacteraceae bacterium CHB4]